MEIIIGLVVVVVLGLLWHANTKKPAERDNDALAPYKVETPKATVNAADLAGVEVAPAPAKCGCGRSQTGYCTGLHKMTNEEYKKHCSEQQLKEQVKPELLKG